jgi:ribosomal protein S27AE
MAPVLEDLAKMEWPTTLSEEFHYLEKKEYVRALKELGTCIHCGSAAYTVDHTDQRVTCTACESSAYVFFWDGFDR